MWLKQLKWNVNVSYLSGKFLGVHVDSSAHLSAASFEKCKIVHAETSCLQLVRGGCLRIALNVHGKVEVCREFVLTCRTVSV